MYRRYETYVWADETMVSTRKLPNDLLFPLQTCSFENFDVPCPRLAEGPYTCVVLSCVDTSCMRIVVRELIKRLPLY